MLALAYDLFVPFRVALSKLFLPRIARRTILAELLREAGQEFGGVAQDADRWPTVERQVRGTSIYGDQRGRATDLPAVPQTEIAGDSGTQHHVGLAAAHRRPAVSKLKRVARDPAGPRAMPER